MIVTKPSLSVVIVSYNSHQTIESCLRSIFKYTSEVEVIVVDNASRDQTKKDIRKFGSQVCLIESEQNLGFARANNLGVKQTHGEFIVFLNPDTRLLHRGSLEKLRDVLAANPDFGIIGPRLLCGDGSIQKSVRNLPTLQGAFREYILKQKNSYDFYLPKCVDLCEVESVVGACMMTRREVFEKVGGFEEKYFLYFEDLELCKTLRSLGLKVGFVPQVEIEHIMGVSGVNQETFSLLQDSAKKYHGLLFYYLIQTVIRLGRLI